MFLPIIVSTLITVLTQVFLHHASGEMVVELFYRGFGLLDRLSPYVVSLIALAGVFATNIYHEKARKEDQEIEANRRGQDRCERELEISRARFQESQARQRRVISQLLRGLWESKERVQTGLEEKSAAIMEAGGILTPVANHHHDQLNALRVSEFYREADLLIELTELEIENQTVLNSLEKLKTLLREEGYSIIHEGNRRLHFLEWMEVAKQHAPFSDGVRNELEKVRQVAARELRDTRQGPSTH